MGNEIYCAPKLINISTGDYAEKVEKVEKYDAGFELPPLRKKCREELKRRIETVGKVTTPIIVTYSTKIGYLIIDGWSRYQIAKELKLDCQALLYESLSPQQTQELFLSENLSQRQMTCKEKKQLAFDIKQKTSLDNSQIARLLGVNASTVFRWFNPKPRPLAVGHMIKLVRKVNSIKSEIKNLFGDLFQLAKSSPENHRLAMEVMPALLFAVENLPQKVHESYSLYDYQCQNIIELSDNTASEDEICVLKAADARNEHLCGEQAKLEPEETLDMLPEISVDNFVFEDKAHVLIPLGNEHFHEDPLLCGDRQNAPEIANAIEPDEEPVKYFSETYTDNISHSKPSTYILGRRAEEFVNASDMHPNSS